MTVPRVLWELTVHGYPDGAPLNIEALSAVLGAPPVRWHAGPDGCWARYEFETEAEARLAQAVGGLMVLRCAELVRTRAPEGK